MARIPNEVVERLKREVSVERLAEAKGIALKKHGDNLVGHCPFHDDRTPSFVVTPSKNLFHCMGACQVGGGPIDFVMRTEKCSFRAACEMLLNDAPSLAASSEAAAPTTSAKLAEIAAPDEPDAVVLRRVVDFYHATLKQSGEALAYLGSRGIESAELVDTFRLGFSNRTLGYRLPAKAVKSGAAIRTQLQRLGVLRESGHEHLSGSLVVPIFDEHGAVVEMYGRKITSGLRAGTPSHLYLPGPHRGVFNLAALKASKDIILCESLIDALTFWSAGFRNVTTSYGVEGFTSELRDALVEHGVEKVLIAYDADEAGQRAANKLAPALAELGMSAFRVSFPKGMDANEYALKLKPAEKSLGTALRAAQWLAGSRAVQVPAEVQAVHAVNQEIADTNGRAGRIRAREMPVESRAAAEEALPPEAAPAPSLAAESVAEPAREEGAAALPPPAERAAALPSAPGVDAEVSEEQVVLRFGDRKWRIRGLAKNLSPTQLKVNVLVSREPAFFVDQLELNSARQRAAFLSQAARELDVEERVLKSDLGKVFSKLEELQDEAIQKALEPQTKTAPTMSEGERNEALSLLKDPKLLDRILADFDRAGVVGEETNKLVGYLAAVSRKLPSPLGVVIQSTSAAGKSSLMDAVLSFVPEEERVQYSAMTGQSLYYMGEADLQHKILAIAEEEGASNAAYALKLLQSEGELTIASTGKNPADGRLVTQEYRVTGPVMVMMTTTAIELDEELMNRCVVLTVDDGREQTRAIHEKQREAQTIEGILARQDRGGVMVLHQNAQRLLKPVLVANPFAKELRFADHATRTRRDHAKYLTLINTIALLHQHQREVKEVEHRGGKVRYIEVTREDIAVADRLAAQVLSRSMDELAPQTRRLLGVIDALVTELAEKQGLDRSDVRFTKRDLQGRAGFGLSQLKVHLKTLLEHEYLAAHRQGHAQRYAYELQCSALEGAHDPFGFEYDANRPANATNRPALLPDRPATGRRPNRPVLSNALREIGKPAGHPKGYIPGDEDNGASYASPASYAPSAPDAAE